MANIILSIFCADDSFRSKFLWGRKPMLAAAAARLEGQTEMIWVDLGGGTGENVSMMSEYMDLSKFTQIYVVDLCSSLCKQARKKVAEGGETSLWLKGMPVNLHLLKAQLLWSPFPTLCR